MFTKKILLLSVSMLLCSQLVASDVMDESPETRKKAKCGTFSSLNVCGSVTAREFITRSGGLLFNGLRNYAVLSNQADVDTGDNILWAATPAGNLSAGITLSGGAITLPTSGIFLVQYSVRFDRIPFDGEAVGTAQLQQTVAGVPTNITQPAIISTTAIDGVTANEPLTQPEVTGYALITTTSNLNNVINLVVSYNNNIALSTATLTDANAQMTILQLN